MSRHIVQPTSLDDMRTVWIQPDPDPKADPGWRLRLDWMRHDNAFLFEEQVLPERVDNPNARRVLVDKASIQLTRANAEWLRDALNDFLGERKGIAALRAALVEALDLGEEANGDPSSCSYSVPVGDRLSALRAVAGGK